MVVDVYFGPCSDPGSTPGVSTNMTNILIIILAVLFVWLLMQSQKSQRKVNHKKQDLVDRIKDRYR